MSGLLVARVAQDHAFSGQSVEITFLSLILRNRYFSAIQVMAFLLIEVCLPRL